MKVKEFNNGIADISTVHEVIEQLELDINEAHKALNGSTSGENRTWLTERLNDLEASLCVLKERFRDE